jgi:hypothetical protein
MAYAAGNGGLRSPREDSFALRNSVGSQMAASTDGRGQLHRRFTTNNIPTLSTPLSPIGQQRRQAAEPTEFTTAVRTSRSHTPSARDGGRMHGAQCVTMLHARISSTAYPVAPGAHFVCALAPAVLLS